MLDDVERSREVARRYGCKWVDLYRFQVPSELLRKVPVELMFRYKFVPLEESGEGRLAIAIADPSQLMMIDEVGLLLRRPIEVRVSTFEQIENTLGRIERGGKDRG